MSTYIWCEDRASGFQFWSGIIEFINSDIIVESKMNNSAIRKAVESINDKNNEYYILIDNAIDNPDVIREVKRIKADISEKNNFHIVNIHSFEFSLLSFEFLENWIFAEVDQLKETRERDLRAKNIFVALMTNFADANQLMQFKKEFGYKETKNTEQISASLLNKLTKNTGFETDKKQLGVCFLNNCCDFSERQNDDICGLDNSRLSSNEKKKLIIEHSVIYNAFKEAGLYDNGI